jgi:hypothetical protein
MKFLFRCLGLVTLTGLMLIAANEAHALGFRAGGFQFGGAAVRRAPVSGFYRPRVVNPYPGIGYYNGYPAAGSYYAGGVAWPGSVGVQVGGVVRGVRVGAVRVGGFHAGGFRAGGFRRR